MYFLSITLALAATVFSLKLAHEQQSILVIDSQTKSSIHDVLIDNEIIPQVLDDFEPTYVLDIVYTKSHENVLLGNNIPVKHVVKRPAFQFRKLNSASAVDEENPSSDAAKNFTLILTDPDAKSRDNPKWSEMCHWVVTNQTDTVVDLSTQESTSADGELVSYKPPGPPPKTGAHRYVFVLLEGDTSDVKPPKERQHWGYGKVRHGVRDWAEENNLRVVGANFFFAENKKQ